jgi:hypothetical protein
MIKSLGGPTVEEESFMFDWTIGPNPWYYDW